MPWNKSNYPDSMKNLPATVRNKAVEIANALLEEKHMDEGIAIATAISRAKDWAENRDIDIHKTTRDAKTTDVKAHGEDRYVIPKDNGWAVKKEKGREKSFGTKKEAVAEARKEAKEANASLTIQKKDGKVQKRVSYNPNNTGPKQK